MFLNELYEPEPKNTYFQTNMPYFQMMWPLSPWFIFSPIDCYFQSNVRSIYSVSYISIIFRVRMRVVIYRDLNALFLEQYPHPPAIFRPICAIFRAFLEQSRFDFQSNGCLFLDQNQVLDPVLFALLAIQRTLFLDCGWIFACNFILYKSNKEEDDNVCKLDGNVDRHICFHLLPRQ